MPNMDEQYTLPNGQVGSSTQLPQTQGAGGLMPMLQQLFAKMAMSRQAPQQQGGMMTQGQVGQQIPGGAPPFTGSNPPGIPSMPNMTASGVGGPMIKPPGVSNSPVEFATKAGRNAQITKDAISGFSNFVGQYKQKKWTQTAAQSEQAWQNYVGLKQAIDNSQDPSAKQMLQKQLDQMMQDPKVMKIFDKAHGDPTSPEGVGVQRAMQSSQQQAQQQLMMEKLRAEIQNQQAEAAYKRAQAGQVQQLTPQNAQERGVQMGTIPSADAAIRAQERKQELADNLQFKREKLQEDISAKRDQMADRRATDQERMAMYRDIAGSKLELQRMMLEDRQAKAQEKTKIPATLVSRYSQAGVILEQVDQMRKQLEDKDLTKYMGPIAGRTTGAMQRVFGNRKVQDFYFSQESLDALLPILHAYRGGAQTHEVFKHAMGTLSIDPNSYKGSLDAIEKLAKNVLNEGRVMFPNDPLWKMDGYGGKDLSKDNVGNESGSPSKIVVSPEDMK